MEWTGALNHIRFDLALIGQPVWSKGRGRKLLVSPEMGGGAFPCEPWCKLWYLRGFQMDAEGQRKQLIKVELIPSSEYKSDDRD